MLLCLLTLFLAISCTYALPTVLTREVPANNSCDARKYSHLIGSIQETMFIQKQELQGLQTLQSLSTQSSTVKAPLIGTQSDFQLNQISIVSTELKAVTVRERSQRLAGELDSPSTMGLAMVAQTRIAAMIDVQSLKGGDADMKMLKSLVERLKKAMTQNEESLRVVDKGCGR